MKTLTRLLLPVFFSITFLAGAQVKIGDDPESIDPASLLELSSTNKALVITRITDAAMNTLNPLPGALVHNIEVGCVFYFDGNQWLNLCEDRGATNLSFDVDNGNLILTDSNSDTVTIPLEDINTNTFTADPIYNVFDDGTAIDSTIVITRTNNNYNFEVGRITGENIVDESINGFSDIQNGTITGNKIQVDQIGASLLNVDVAGDGLSQDPMGALQLIQGGETDGLILKWNADIQSWGLATDNIGINFTDNDAFDGLSEFNDGYDINIDAATITIVDDALQVASRGINTDQIADGAITSVKILNGAVTFDKLPNGTVNGQLLQWNGTAWVLVQDTNLQITEADGVEGNEVVDATDGTLVRNGSGTEADPYTLDVAADGITNREMALNAVAGANVRNASITYNKLVDGTANGQLLQWDGTAWVLVEAANLQITEADGVEGNEVVDATDGTLVRNGSGTEADPYTLDVAADGITNTELALNAVAGANVRDASINYTKLVDGTANGQLLQWDGTAWVLVEASNLQITEADGVEGNEVIDATDGTLVRNGSGTEADPYTLGVAADGITNREMALNAVAGANVRDASINYTKLVDGTANGQLLQWDGTAWVLVEAANLQITEADGVEGNEVIDATDGTLVRNGSGTEADPYTLDVAADGITNTEIGDDAITTENITNGQVQTDDIANANVTLTKLANGENVGEILQWNGTSWELMQNENLATANLILDGIRTHDLNSNNLIFGGIGNVAIGSPSGELENKLTIIGSTRTSGLLNSRGSAGVPSYRFSDNGDTGMFLANDNGSLGFSANDVEAMRIDNNQNIGVGLDFLNDASIDARLHVGGDAIIEGQIYSNSTDILPIPDYVFQNYFDGFSALNEAYNFKSLEKIETFIKKHKHLPGVTSAAQAQKDGHWNLTHSNLQNLEKIEELFLYTIEQQKQLEALKNENTTLAKELDALKKEMEMIKAMLVNKQ